MRRDHPADARHKTTKGSFAQFYESALPGQLRSATLILGSRAVAADIVQDAFTFVLQLSWSPAPGIVFEITTTNLDRTIEELIDLAEATRVITAEEWARTHN